MQRHSTLVPISGPELIRFFWLPPKQQENCIRILEYLALHGSSTKYTVEKNAKISHGSIYNCFKILHNKRLIQEESSKTYRTGLPSVTYGLTLTGLLAIYPKIRRSGKLNVEIEGKKFFERHKSHLPLIFGKWEYFQNKNLERVVEARLEYSSVLQADKEHIYERFFLGQFTDSELSVKWLEALRADVDIRNWITNKLRVKIEKLDTTKKEMKTILRRISKGISVSE